VVECALCGELLYSCAYYIHVCVHIRIYIHTCLYIYIHIHIYVHTHAHTHTQIIYCYTVELCVVECALCDELLQSFSYYLYLCVYIYVYISIHVYICTYMYVYIYIYMYAHTRTQIIYRRALCGRMYNVRFLTIQLCVWLNVLCVCERERVCVWRERAQHLFI